MVDTRSAPSPVRTGTSHTILNGQLGRDGAFRESQERHLDDSQTDATKVRNDLGAGDRLAMVVQKTRKWMKESSPAEKFIGAVLSAILVVMVTIGGMVYHLNREVGESIIFQTSHLESHPNKAIEEDVDEINETLKSMDDRLDDLETFQVYGPRPRE